MPKIGWQSDLHGKMNLNIFDYYDNFEGKEISGFPLGLENSF